MRPSSSLPSSPALTPTLARGCSHRQQVLPAPRLICFAGSQDSNNLRPTITSTRPPRQSAPPPEQVPVEHSATYLLRSRRPTDEEDDLARTSSAKPNQPFTGLLYYVREGAGNAVEWYLRRLDKSVDDNQVEPSAAAKAYYRASRTQAGSSAAKGMGSVVGGAAKLGAEAVKVAAPVGKWAVMQGLGAAGRLISSSSRKPSQKKDTD